MRQTGYQFKYLRQYWAYKVFRAAAMAAGAAAVASKLNGSSHDEDSELGQFSPGQLPCQIVPPAWSEEASRTLDHPAV